MKMQLAIQFERGGVQGNVSNDKCPLGVRGTGHVSGIRDHLLE